MDEKKLKRFRKRHNIPQMGAVAAVTGSGESRATIRTWYGETFTASCTRGAHWALKGALDK